MPRTRSLFALALAALLLAPAAFAQRIVVSPQAIVVNPLPAFDVEVWVDRDRQGRDTPAYRVGEEIQIGVRVSEDAYVYLFSVAADGEIVQILPNRYDAAGRDNYLTANTTRTFPPQGARYSFVVDPPAGLSKVIAVASRQQLDTRELAQFRTEGDFLATSRQGEDAFARALSIVVRPLPQEAWVTATALYWVGTAPQQGAYGTINVTSQPSRSEVYVDGQFAGYTPLNFGTRPGRYDVEIRRDGYVTHRETIQVRPDRSTQVTAQLATVRNEGTATFTSSPSGADVYIGNRFVGTTPTGQVTLPAGQHQARFDMPGRRSVTQSFTVQRDRNATVRAELAALGGTLDLTANVGDARVFVDGREVGRVPSGTGRLVLRELPEGLHELVVMAPGFETYVTSVRIRDGETTTLTVRQARY